MVEIPESQADAERVGIDTEQEVPESETEGAISDNWPELEAFCRSTALLLSCNGEESSLPDGYGCLWKSHRITRVRCYFRRRTPLDEYFE